MTLTCIISQFDLRAGTRGSADCMVAGRVRAAKADIAIATGDVATPTKRERLMFSATRWMAVIPQIRKNRDS